MLRPAAFALLATSLCARLAHAAPTPEKPAATDATPSIAQKVAGLQAMPGYFNLYWDERQGKLYLEIDRWENDFLYQTSLPAGIGSNDIGFDRGQLGATRVVRFQRVGPRVLLIEENLAYRASSADAAERRAVRESFAESTLFGFTVAAQTDRRVLVDATDFFLRDVRDVPAVLQRQKQGSYKLESSRCVVWLERTRSFPENTEVEALLTFTGDEAGQWVRDVVPSTEAITVREHHSLVALPPAGFHPRAYDPRMGFYAVEYADYSAPLGDSLQKRLTVHHRLQKKDPAAAMSEAVRPIVYYLDRGTPEPIRSALLEGASWWGQAFEAAGYRGAFRVELMPEGMDPMDTRYNVIQWVHRATRGWSYGVTVVDPRTGEIIKGHVSLGSLRVRQDYLIAEGLLAPYETGKPASPRMRELALARLRQLAAHEVGHTLGLNHNYSASTVERASVMDYPPPVATLESSGSIDVSAAYATGIGEWDKVAIGWGYQDFAPGVDERAALDRFAREAFAKGQRYLTDQDARPAGSSSSLAHLWDSGRDPVDELGRLMQVRAAALARFGESVIQPGAPLATIEDALVPIYLMHRYQVEAAAKVVGGLDYVFALRGDGQTPTTPVSPERQRRALRAVLGTLSPDALVLPEPLLRLIPPRPPQYDRGREHFRIHTAPAFDALAPVEAAAEQSLRFLFSPERSARLIEQHARTPDSPGLDEVLEAVLAATWKSARPAGLRGEVARAVDSVALLHLLALCRDERATMQARAVAWQALDGLKAWLSSAAPRAKDPAERAHLAYALVQIGDFVKDPHKIELPASPEPPDGPPIGSD